MILVITAMLFYFMSHGGTPEAKWGLSAEAMFWVDAGISLLAGIILNVSFNQS
jgi:hypothetical protein